MKRKNILMVILLIALSLNTAACSTTKVDEGEKDEIIAYTSVYPIYDFTKKIAGDRIKVELLVPPGAEPHGWEPSAKVIAKLEQSQVFLYNGLELDPWAERIAASLSKENLISIAVAEIDTIQPMTFNEEEQHGEEEYEKEHNHGSYDPHVWLDPIIAEEMARAIKDTFIEIDGKNSDYYEENFNNLKQELQDLDRDYKEALSQVEKKDFIVSHAAFGYMANRYGLNQIAILGLAPQAEPSPAKLVELTSLVGEYDMHTIFYEQLSSPKAADVLANETGVKVEVLNPIGGLTQEEMDRGEDYISIMRENLEKLVQGLQ
jgi:zinc transport system substrate-binding protein